MWCHRKEPNRRMGNSNKKQPTEDSPLCVAIRNKCMDTALHLIKNKSALDIPDKNGEYPLHVAILNGNHVLLEELLANGAEPNVIDSHGMSPLHVAIIQKDTSMVSALLSKGAYPDNMQASERLLVTSPLRLAVSHAVNEDMVELLLKAGVNPDRVDQFGMSTSGHAICISSNDSARTDIALKMVRRSKKLDQRCRNGVSYLSWALSLNCCPVVQLILQRIDSEKLHHKEDQHPILIAIKNGCEQCFRNLIKHRGGSPLFEKSKEKLPCPLEMALIQQSWNIDLTCGIPEKIFQRRSCLLSDDRLYFAHTIISEHGVNVEHTLFERVLKNTVSLRTAVHSAKKVVSLCISAYGGFPNLPVDQPRKSPELTRARDLFETLSKCQEYDLALKLYDAGVKYNTGNVLAIHDHHERNNLPMDFIATLNDLPSRVRSLKNMAVLVVRATIPENVIFKAKSLGVPKLIRDIIALGNVERLEDI